jgi:hypothetical protein
MTYDEFKDYVKKNDQNKIKDNGGICGIFKEIKDKNSGFTIVCKKCGSMNILIEGEDGVTYGEYTGYQSGENVIKCIDCGNAISIWK